MSYPSAVEDVTQNVTATVIPYITQYDNVNITTFSTLYASGASGQTVIPSPTASNLKWTTLGTTLTLFSPPQKQLLPYLPIYCRYPTTYLAFPSPVAGISKSNPSCYAALTTIRVDPADISHLVYASTDPADHDRITASVVAFLETLPSISAAVSPFSPSQCSPFAGQGTRAPLAGSSSVAATNSVTSSVAAVTHTSVQFLITQGQAVIARSPGTAAPQTTPQATAQEAPGKGDGTSSVSTPTTRPIITVGGTTIAAGADGVFGIGGQTLAPGGSAVIVEGTTISIVTGGSAAVVNGQTSTLAVATGSSSASSTPGLVGGSAAVNLRAWWKSVAVGCLGAVVGFLVFG